MICLAFSQLEIPAPPHFDAAPGRGDWCPYWWPWGAEDPQCLLTHQKRNSFAQQSFSAKQIFSVFILGEKTCLTRIFDKFADYLIHTPYFAIKETKVQERKWTSPGSPTHGPFPTVFPGIPVSPGHTFRATSVREVLIGHLLGPFCCFSHSTSAFICVIRYNILRILSQCTSFLPNL